ncbi:hypothetical protein Mlute_02554 [Meiothermus luteus]|jgi:hypothetical protein|uniref:Uncharacterized protein n=1 Tax=Meiothermus luteus TaxID=2026184 RepID=A0A399ED44_9DEIN|nr:hypothetical protein [Meiothermus luteus]RIH82255.1 hypothetical protein Mlute_02554 [Meiothermus luteus]RMH58302.1 MAG: hypothetical protein D6684_01115 [Deinococcota bacterium]
MANEAEKLEWFEIQLRIKTLEVMLGPKYREAMALTLATLYDQEKIQTLSKQLGVSPEGLLQRLEKIRLELGIEQEVTQRALKRPPRG